MYNFPCGNIVKISFFPGHDLIFYALYVCNVVRLRGGKLGNGTLIVEKNNVCISFLSTVINDAAT